MGPQWWFIGAFVFFVAGTVANIMAMNDRSQMQKMRDAALNFQIMAIQYMKMGDEFRQEASRKYADIFAKKGDVDVDG